MFYNIDPQKLFLASLLLLRRCKVKALLCFNIAFQTLFVQPENGGRVPSLLSPQQMSWVTISLPGQTFFCWTRKWWWAPSLLSPQLMSRVPISLPGQTCFVEPENGGECRHFCPHNKCPEWQFPYLAKHFFVEPENGGRAPSLLSQQQMI